MNFVKPRGYTLLLRIDRNCHSTLYGRETNHRGEKWEDFISNHKLVVEDIDAKLNWNVRFDNVI